MSRNVNLQVRKESTRDKKTIKVVNFDLDEIKSHFSENMQSLTRHFSLADELCLASKIEEAMDIWRTQIVFLESALDFYIHEITKHGMRKIFNNEWGRSQKFLNYNLKISEVLHVMIYPEDTTWFESHVNNTFKSATFISYESIKEQLNLLGIKIECVAGRLYPELSNEDAFGTMRKHLNDIHQRRNQIVHQSDRNHHDGKINTITKEFVETCIHDIENIVNAIHYCAGEDSCRLPISRVEDEIEN